MIRINLAGFSETERQERSCLQHAELRAGQPGRAIYPGGGVLLIAGAGNGLYWSHPTGKRSRSKCNPGWRNRKIANWPTSRCATWSGRGKRLLQAAGRVIDQLRANQTGPVALLAMIGDTVNGTEAVWLNSLQDQGASVAIDGTALSSDAVANLISNLQKTGFFPQHRDQGKLSGRRRKGYAGVSIHAGPAKRRSP